MTPKQPHQQSSQRPIRLPEQPGCGPALVVGIIFAILLWIYVKTM